MFQFLRSTFSVRFAAAYLPAGSPAPRLPIQLIETSTDLLPPGGSHSPWYTIDDLYTSTDGSYPELSSSDASLNEPWDLSGIISCLTDDREELDASSHDYYNQTRRRSSSDIINKNPVNKRRKPMRIQRHQASENVCFAFRSNQTNTSSDEDNEIHHCSGKPNENLCSCVQSFGDKGKCCVRKHAMPSRRLFLKSSRNLRSNKEHNEISVEGSCGCSYKESPKHCASLETNRIAELEAELSYIRAQLARLIVAQEGRHLLEQTSAGEFDERHEADGESDASLWMVKDPLPGNTPKLTNTDSATSPTHPLLSSGLQTGIVSAPVIPPPPPPPTQSSTSVFDWRKALLEKRKLKHLSSSDSNISSSRPVAADMGQVLRELQSGSIKLRSIPRSPNGTPLREHSSPNYSGFDPCSIIARALKQKFEKTRAAMNISSGLDESLPENQSSNLDSVTEMPLSSPVKNDAPSQILAPFGQHLLRSTPYRDHKATTAI